MYLLSGLKTQDPLISHCRWLSGMLLVGRLLSGLCSCWAVCYIIVVRNSYVVMKEGSTVSLVCVRECWVDVALIQSCPRVLTKTWNDHQLLWLQLRATNPSPSPLALSTHLNLQSLWLLCFPVAVFARGHCWRGLRSLQASGCPFMLLCLKKKKKKKNHMTVYDPHTVVISTLRFICTEVSRGRSSFLEHLYNVEKKIQPDYFQKS